MPDDVEVLETAIDLLPELRASAIALRQARRIGLTYPIEDPKTLAKLLDKGAMKEAGYSINFADIISLLPPEYFPISDEGELIGRTYAAFVRCREGLSEASRADDRSLQQLRLLASRAGSARKDG